MQKVYILEHKKCSLTSLNHILYFYLLMMSIYVSSPHLQYDWGTSSL